MGQGDPSVARAIRLVDHIAYAEGAVVSKTLVNRGTGTVTLFAFDRGQGLSEHTAPFEAVVEIVEGAAVVTIGDDEVEARGGDLVIMPAGVPHALRAAERFKMLLIMIRS